MVDSSSAERPFLTSLAGRDVHIRCWRRSLSLSLSLEQCQTSRGNTPIVCHTLRMENSRPVELDVRASGCTWQSFLVSWDTSFVTVNKLGNVNET